MLKKEFQKFKNFVFDLDGTFWYWDELTPGARELYELLRKEGKEVYFVSNNSMLPPHEYDEKLKELGVDVEPERITCSVEIIAKYLKENKMKKIFCLSRPEVRDFFAESGFEITEDADCVVVTYHDIEDGEVRKAAEIARGGVPIITNAKGMVWALKDRQLPGVGVIVKKVEDLSGKKAKMVAKPSQCLAKDIDKKYSMEAEETVFFGDSLNSDLKFADLMGWKFAFVLTGHYTMEDLKKRNEEPDFVLKDLGEVINI